MTHEMFNRVLDFRIEQMKMVLKMKSTEYSDNRDRLHNFKRAALMMGCTPERALIGMWAKHVVSILDIVEDIESSYPQRAAIRWDVVSEKITDAINYLVLLEALLVEREGSRQELYDNYEPIDIAK